MNMTFAGLFKRDSKGKIRYWEISTVGNEIHTTFGELNGKLQTTIDVIAEGKNIGKKNETTAEQQAYAEAEAKWEKQIKKGYIAEQRLAELGKTDSEFIDQDTVAPMLAHSFADHGHKIKFPVYVSPKLDGIRCVATIKGGVAKLWTRNRKPITGVPHINRELEKLFPTEDVIWDGELYNHKYKNNFEEIVSFVRNETPKDGHEVVEYHIFDKVESGVGFIARLKDIANLIDGRSDKLIKVRNEVASDETELMEFYQQFRDEGYEGAMVRVPDSLYEFKRSRSLLKMKEFLDDEFTIVGGELGRGKLSDCIASFICKTKDGATFNVKMEGSYDRLQEFAKDHSLWHGKKLTVKYQNLTDTGIPRFPIGKSIRDDV